MKPSLPLNLYDAASVREMDRRAMDNHDLGDGKLMERAGEAAFNRLRSAWPTAQRIAVIAGSGNNGGDGYVLARHACEAGLVATVFALREPKQADAKQAAQRFQSAGGQTESIDTFAQCKPDVIVDALMGTGLDRPLEGDFAQAVRLMNDYAAEILAIDIPSGLNADTGAVMGAAVHAHHTVTFIGMKCGLLTGRGPAFTGTLHFSGLNVPADIQNDIQPVARRVTDADLHAALPARERDAHKGHFGHVLVLGGDYGMAGAARMTAEAALRTGAGLVTVYTRPEHIGPIITARPELMCRAGGDLDALIEKVSVIAVGPGLGTGDFGRRLLKMAMDSDKPLVVDADALNLLAAKATARGNWILTPHPGEAGRLLGSASADVQKDRFTAVRELTQRYNAVVVLKGAGTLIAAPDETPAIVDRGNPGMASGGMGDVLTGIIAAVQAQTNSAFDAARIGAFVHATAGDRAASDGERGLVALDLVKELRAVINSIP